MDKAKENLCEILEAHRLWLESDGEKGTPANLSEADLSEANLNAANLRGADLSEADLRGADLRGADLSEANLWRSDLRKADLWRADLSKANLSKADLRGADLSEGDLSRAYLCAARLSEANLGQGRLSEANLRGADLRGADLRGADLSEADLRRADLSKANLNTAHLSEADLRRANLRGADLRNSCLHQAEISGACLDDANTSRWNIEGIICTHLVSGPDKKRIDYAAKEFEQKHAHLDKFTDIVLHLPLSELTHWVGLMTGSAINQHQPNIPVRFKGQEAVSDKTTKLSFVVFASDDNEVRKTQDYLISMQQNLKTVAQDVKEVRQFLEDETQPKGTLRGVDEIHRGPSCSPFIVKPAEIERIVTERYTQLPSILKKVGERIEFALRKK